MKAKPTLYELLGVPQGAAVSEIQAAYRQQMNALEQGRAGLQAQEFNDRAQLLRLAYSTLTDPVSRTGYDNKLAASAAAKPAAAVTRALSLRPEGEGQAPPSAEVRADALALRADALSLRADAMLLRAGVEPGAGSTGGALAAGALRASKTLVRAIGLLVVIAIGTFAVARCSMGGSEGQAAMQQKAAEKAALQEYYQTYGVRPASMAEMELMEVARRRKESQERQADQDRRQAEQKQRQQAEDERRLREEAHRRGQEVSAELRRAEEQQRYEQLRDEQIKLQEEQTRLQREQVQRERERLRDEQQRQRWQDSLRR